MFTRHLSYPRMHRRLLAIIPPARARAGQALVETAMLIALFLVSFYGVLAVHRLVVARLQVATIAREAARVMAEAPSAEAALAAGQDRTAAVAVGLTLRPDRLTVTLDPGPFDRTGVVRATARYRVDMRGLPLFGLPDPVVDDRAVQPIQVHASR